MPSPYDTHLPRIGLIGSGNLARALARGLGEPVFATDGGSGRAAALVGELGGEALGSNRELAQRAAVVVLAHEPHQLEEIADEIRDAARIVVSLLGRTPSERVRAVLPDAEVLRVTPNLAIELRRGVSVFATPRPGVSDGTEANVKALFAQVGLVVDVPEQLMPVAIGCSGVGPAYWALLADAWAGAAARHGLDKALATTLVVETMAGSAALLAGRDDAMSLTHSVATRGGSTARGLAALEGAGAREALDAALDAVVGAYADAARQA